MKYDRIIALGIATLLVLGVVAYGLNKAKSPSLGGSFRVGKQVVAGTPTNFARLPLSYVYESSTTTDPALDRGGEVIQQEMNVEEADAVRLVVSAIGGTATSTFGMLIQGSYDASTYFDYDLFDSTLATSTVNSGGSIGSNTTSTIAELSGVLSFQPGVATSSRSYLISTGGWRYLRFILFGEDVDTDPSDYIKALVEVYPRAELNR